jgi:hypothetical protein
MLTGQQLRRRSRSSGGSSPVNHRSRGRMRSVSPLLQSIDGQIARPDDPCVNHEGDLLYTAPSHSSDLREDSVETRAREAVRREAIRRLKVSHECEGLCDQGSDEMWQDSGHDAMSPGSQQRMSASTRSGGGEIHKTDAAINPSNARQQARQGSSPMLVVSPASAPPWSPQSLASSLQKSASTGEIAGLEAAAGVGAGEIRRTLSFDRGKYRDNLVLRDRDASDAQVWCQVIHASSLCMAILCNSSRHIHTAFCSTPSQTLTPHPHS